MVRCGGWRGGAWAGLICILGACGLSEPPATPEESARITADRFIEVYAALRQAAAAAQDTLAFDSMRDEILRTHGVTEDDLFEFARAHSRNIESMIQLWDSIRTRLSAVGSAVDSAVDSAAAAR